MNDPAGTLEYTDAEWSTIRDTFDLREDARQNLDAIVRSVRQAKKASGGRNGRRARHERQWSTIVTDSERAYRDAKRRLRQAESSLRELLGTEALMFIERVRKEEPKMGQTDWQFRDRATNLLSKIEALNNILRPYGSDVFPTPRLLGLPSDPGGAPLKPSTYAVARVDQMFRRTTGRRLPKSGPGADLIVGVCRKAGIKTGHDAVLKAIGVHRRRQQQR